MLPEYIVVTLFQLRVILVGPILADRLDPDQHGIELFERGRPKNHSCEVW